MDSKESRPWQTIPTRTKRSVPPSVSSAQSFVPIAQAYVHLEAADLMRFKACALFDRREACGAEANMALLLAAAASWEAANACLQFHGGFGFACEYDVERKFRETRLYQVAPISTNLILSYVAEHVLGMPRSF
jgi:acyl-CoA dehydrogenase